MGSPPPDRHRSSSPAVEDDDDDEVMIVFDTSSSTFKTQLNAHTVILIPTTPVKPKAPKSPEVVKTLEETRIEILGKHSIRGELYDDLQKIAKAVAAGSLHPQMDALGIPPTPVGTETETKKTEIMGDWDGKKVMLDWTTRGVVEVPPEEPVIEPTADDDDIDIEELPCSESAPISIPNWTFWKRPSPERLEIKIQKDEPTTDDEDDGETQSDIPPSTITILSVVGNAVLPGSSIVEETIDQESAGPSTSIIDLEIEKEVDLENAKFSEGLQNVVDDDCRLKIVTPGKLQSPSKQVNAEDLSVAAENCQNRSVKSFEDVEVAISKATNISKESDVIILETSTVASSTESCVVGLPLEQELDELFPSVPDVNTDMILKSSQTSGALEVMDEDSSKKRKQDETEQQEVNPTASKRARLNKDDQNGSKEEGECAEDEDAEDDDKEKDDIDPHAECRQQQQLLFREIEVLRAKVDRLTYRQMFMDDFALVEFASKFKTIFHTREELLNMGKQRVVSNPAHVLAPGSPYLIGILKLINQKTTENEKVSTDQLIFSDAELKKIEEEFRNSETFNTDVMSNPPLKKSVPSETVILLSSSSSGESLPKVGLNQKASSSSLVSLNGNNAKSKGSNSLDWNFSKTSDMLVNPFFNRPKKLLNNCQTNTAGNDQSPMTGLQTLRSALNQVQPSNAKTTTPAQSKQSEESGVCARKLKTPRGLRKKICGICGDEYILRLLKVHANLHAGICFECHECKVLYTEYQKAQDCIRAHGFDQVRPIRAFVKNDNEKLTAIGQEDINRLQDITISKITNNQHYGGDDYYMSNPQLLDHHHQMMQQQSLQRQQMMQQQSLQRQRATQSMQPLSMESKSANFQEVLPRNLSNQQTTQQQNIERLRQQVIQQQNFQRQQLIQENNIQRQQQIIQDERRVDYNPIVERPGYFTTSYVPSPAPEPQAATASLDGSYDPNRSISSNKAKRKRQRYRKNAQKQDDFRQQPSNQSYQSHQAMPGATITGGQGRNSNPLNPHYTSYSEYAKDYLQGKHYRKDGR